MALDFLELSSWAAFDVRVSVIMERLILAISGLATTLPSPLKDTVFVVVAVFQTLLELTNKNTASITKTAVPD